VSILTKTAILLLIIGTIAVLSSASKPEENPSGYSSFYKAKIDDFSAQQSGLLDCIAKSDVQSPDDLEKIRVQIGLTRDKMKGIDIWLRYLDPIAYKKINGPLPVEWETEVFEKFEKPYKRVGAGLTLAALYLEEPEVNKDTLRGFILASIQATGSYLADSTTKPLPQFSHFLLCNRLYLLNLAAIYTTGFECPDTERIIPELRSMMAQVKDIYQVYNQSFPTTPISAEYAVLYDKALEFAVKQPSDYAQFDHFTFIRDYINPLFVLNQHLIRQYEVFSASFVDYSLDNEATSIFDKDLYYGQNVKGLFLRVTDARVLAEIEALGKLLFYDPLLSGNNLRSCASCHKPSTGFTDTMTVTSMQFNRKDFLARNTPSLMNMQYNHLLMLDGKHISLKHQANGVVSNPEELNSSSEEILKKVLDCPDYKDAFTRLLAFTPQETDITFGHVVSAITVYLSRFGQIYAPFDEAMDRGKPLATESVQGFNLFMSKAQCATCHFVPQFSGVKPPYVGSEFEVLGVPADKKYSQLSPDKGRYEVNPAHETLHAFRTGTLRNITQTKPYMHNGVFSSLEEVIDFYDGGGGAGRGLPVDNQTLSSDSLHLSVQEKSHLIAFLRALDENIQAEVPPTQLPASRSTELNARKVGGAY